ncbi:MAG TPA: SRPBCC domain-containing protein [Thermoanaerobaculia bacterium]|nr:SRPBCC domain-containing protein [Thermoanaerobaculia bacterium]
MTDRPYSLDREITIRAHPETVFRYFTDSERFARWWGAGSTIEPSPGGRVRIQYPNAVVVTGEVVVIDPPRQIVFTYAYGEGPVADASLVTVSLDPVAEGTRLRLRHDFSSEAIRDAHVQGWRYQLGVFSRVVSEEAHAKAAERVDAFLRAWGEPDPVTRRGLLESCAAPGIVFRDAFSATDGLDEMLANLDAVRVHMPGVSLTRAGDVRLAHGTALVAWTARKASGDEVGRGTNLVDFAPDGRIARMIGFWDR